MLKEPSNHKEPFDMPLMLLKLATILTVCLLMLSVSGCVTAGNGTDTGCLAFHPIYVSRHDGLTDETARQILAHNEVGARLCKW